jgi:hypothetical protein
MRALLAAATLLPLLGAVPAAAAPVETVLTRFLLQDPLDGFLPVGDLVVIQPGTLAGATM